MDRKIIKYDAKRWDGYTSYISSYIRLRSSFLPVLRTRVHHTQDTHTHTHLYNLLYCTKLCGTFNWHSKYCVTLVGGKQNKLLIRAWVYIILTTTTTLSNGSYTDTHMSNIIMVCTIDTKKNKSTNVVLHCPHYYNVICVL